MKVQELRIGNWVNYMMIDGQFHPQKIKSGQQIDEIGHYQPEPIPITPELLEKAGFDRSNDTFAIDLYKKGEVRWELEMCLIIDLKEPATYINNTGGDGMLRYNVQYLHQLQNLFYCLTGQELEINLNV